MIRISPSRRPQQSTPAWHADFLALVPMIRRRAQRAFRHLDPEARDDAVQEVLACALVAFLRLVESGRSDLAYATPLATYGICRFNAGRMVAGRLNVCDVTSRYCQVLKGVRVGRLDHFDTRQQKWKEILVADRHAGPAETAAARIDFGNWLERLPGRQRRMAELLATGESPSEAAEEFGVSLGRVSQIRRELEDSWQEFQVGARDAVAVA
jgi:DNA-directed RNA polymerase specialized sigma24 family protein